MGGGGGSQVGSPGGTGSDITIVNSAVSTTGGTVRQATSAGGGGAGIGGGGGSAGTIGGLGSHISIDAASVVYAQGGTGGNAGAFGLAGGGGAAVGGGGAGNGRDGGGANGIAIAGATLARDSRGGVGGPGYPNNGGTGSLCGTGGDGGGGVSGVEVMVDGTDYCTEGTIELDSSSRPDPGYPGYPVVPTFTDPLSLTVDWGDLASFTVTPQTGAYLFQWQQSTDGGTTWNDLAASSTFSGTTTDTLRIAGATMAINGNQYRCLVGNSVAQDIESDSATLTILPRTVAFTATQVGGAAGTGNSTGIELTFSEPVTGLDASDITVTNDTGQVTTGVLTEASGTGTNAVWLLEITTVAAEGEVFVEVADFAYFQVTSAAQTVDVYMFVPPPRINYSVTLKQTKGGTATVSPANAPAGTTVTLVATPDAGYKFNGWQVSPAVTWTKGSASSATASFTMPQDTVTVTPLFVLGMVGPPPPPVIKPPVTPPPTEPPPTAPGNPPSSPPGNQAAPPKVPYTGDNQNANTTGLLLMASLAGVYSLALWRRRQPGLPAKPAPKHLAI